MTAAFALALVVFALTGAIPWLTTALPLSLALASAVASGALVLAVAGALVPAGAAGWVAGAGLGLAAWGAAFYLRARHPLVRLAREERRESLANQAVAWFLLVLLGFIAGLYLWANAVHPPVLADTIFHWSGPARGLGAANGFAVRLSQYYYALADTDLGWKFLWSWLNLLPWAVLYGALRYQGRGRLAAAGAALVPALSFSLLFWGSSGQPFLFLTGVLLLAWAWLLEHRRMGLYMAWPALAVLVWSGPFWGALAAVALLAYASRLEHHKAFRWSAAAAAVALLVWWASAIEPQWRLTDDVVRYYARDAWNTARYGPLVYMTVAFFLRSLGRQRIVWTSVAGIAASLAIFTLDLSARDGKSLEILLHVTGNQLFACVLFLGWFLAAITSRPRH